jgi:hypothetical protein
MANIILNRWEVIWEEMVKAVTSGVPHDDAVTDDERKSRHIRCRNISFNAIVDVAHSIEP